MTSLSFLCQRLALSEEQLCLPDDGTGTHTALSHTLLIDFGICDILLYRVNLKRLCLLNSLENFSDNFFFQNSLIALKKL